MVHKIIFFLESYLLGFVDYNPRYQTQTQTMQ